MQGVRSRADSVDRRVKSDEACKERGVEWTVYRSTVGGATERFPGPHSLFPISRFPVPGSHSPLGSATEKPGEW